MFANEEFANKGTGKVHGNREIENIELMQHMLHLSKIFREQGRNKDIFHYEGREGPLLKMYVCSDHLSMYACTT